MGAFCLLYSGRAMLSQLFLFLRRPPALANKSLILIYDGGCFDLGLGLLRLFEVSGLGSMGWKGILLLHAVKKSDFVLERLDILLSILNEGFAASF